MLLQPSGTGAQLTYHVNLRLLLMLATKMDVSSILSDTDRSIFPEESHKPHFAKRVYGKKSAVRGFKQPDFDKWP